MPGPQKKDELITMDIGEAHSRLHQLDREQWRLSATHLALILTLFVAMMAVWFFVVGAVVVHPARLLVVVGVATVLMMAYLVLGARRQRAMMEARREVAAQLGVIVAAETLKLIVGNSPEAESERRRLQRAICDHKLTVVMKSDAGVVKFFGRVRDVCEHGMGAIVPASLPLNEEVMLLFALEDNRALEVKGIVRQRSGFRYGFEFRGLGAVEQQEIERYRLGNEEVPSMAHAPAGHDL